MNELKGGKEESRKEGKKEERREERREKGRHPGKKARAQSEVLRLDQQVASPLSIAQRPSGVSD